MSGQKDWADHSNSDVAVGEFIDGPLLDMFVQFSGPRERGPVRKDSDRQDINEEFQTAEDLRQEYLFRTKQRAARELGEDARPIDPFTVWMDNNGDLLVWHTMDECRALFEKCKKVGTKGLQVGSGG